jgi:hypothetical protein
MRFISEAIYREAMGNITKPEGCIDLINHCRQMGNIDDPEFSGSNQKANEACIEAFTYCFGLSGGSFDALNNLSAMAETQFLMSEHSLRV